MENHTDLTLTSVDHPDSCVERVGFDLTDPYMEQCCRPVIGPSAAVLLRRMSTLWTERVLATVAHAELIRSSGLGAGDSVDARLSHATDRAVRCGFATWHDKRRALDVTLQSPGLGEHRSDLLLEWTRQAHAWFLATHLCPIIKLDETAPHVAATTARLDRLQRPSTIHTATPTAPATTIERTRHRRHDHPASPRPTHDLVITEDQIRRAHACRFPFGKPAGGRVVAAS
jgi:hypothetical protein